MKRVFILLLAAVLLTSCSVGQSEASLRKKSTTYISSTIFESVPTFEVTSNDVHNGAWDDKVTNTKYGENLSPDLSWEKVEGASQYVVVMIDGVWLHMDVFTTETSLAEGAIKRGERGNQYVGPYPPTGTHTYSVFVFALKNDMGKVLLAFDAGGNSIDRIYQELNKDKDGNEGNVIAYGRLDDHRAVIEMAAASFPVNPNAIARK